MTPQCCICGSHQFREFRGRGKIQCAKCRSLERTRLIKLALDKTVSLGPTSQIIHFAPEHDLARSLKQAAGDGYSCYDIDPDRYPQDLNPKRFDLTKDIFDLPSDTYDLIIHSHVMEHIPCNLTVVLYHLHRALKPTGLHVFAIPITPGKYRSDFADMTDEQRKAAFRHHEHFRDFGRDDLDQTLGMVFDLKPYDFAANIDHAVLRQNMIAEKLWTGIHGSSVFVQDKQSIKIG